MDAKIGSRADDKWQVRAYNYKLEDRTDPRELVTVVEVKDFAVGCDVDTDVKVFPRVVITNVVLRQLLSSHQASCVSISSSIPTLTDSSVR